MQQRTEAAEQQRRDVQERAATLTETARMQYIFYWELCHICTMTNSQAVLNCVQFVCHS